MKVILYYQRIGFDQTATSKSTHATLRGALVYATGAYFAGLILPDIITDQNGAILLTREALYQAMRPS